VICHQLQPWFGERMQQVEQGIGEHKQRTNQMDAWVAQAQKPCSLRRKPPSLAVVI
jgi:hypothetical protein